MTKYIFIDAQKADYPIRSLCAALDVPPSSYYDWHRTGRARHVVRTASTAELVWAIRQVHEDSDATYGSPRIHDGLRKAGRVVSLRRVAEAMADARIVGVSGREHTTTTTTRRDRMTAPFPDLVERNFLPLFADTV